MSRSSPKPISSDRVESWESNPKSSRGPVPRISSTFEISKPAPLTERNGDVLSEWDVIVDITW
ncbi:hypothetical protein BLNAU_11156 [Blattamonas nauphoetae]|uniref:Uncharacterized protein n=1 Tax=Blattamonas nauphoetae TaxID=2049346 RepID=A0ABQ9XPC9_9EUKA|nr:hypothetical protein BLNAU_11156 [Blattamonas nauphoetae]